MATRRTFVKTATGVILACDLVAIGGCGGGTAGDDDDDGASPTPPPDITGGVMTLPLADYPALSPVDGFVRFSGIAGVPGVTQVIVAHVDASTFVCLSSRCTHQGCTLGYSGAANTFPCNCHGSEFAADGSVIDGPATVPVDAFLTTFDGTTVTVDFNTTV